nr:hypothetical protein [Pedobacter sp. ASV19]
MSNWNLSSIKSKIQNKHFLSLTGNGIMSILGMVTYSLLYHSLTLSKMGIWVFFTTGFSLLDTFRSGFLTTAFIKFYSGSEEMREREVIGSTWYIALLITGGFILLNVPAFLLERYIGDVGFSMLLKWFGLTYILTLPFYMATNIVQGEQRFDRLLYIRLVNVRSYNQNFNEMIFESSFLKWNHLKFYMYSDHPHLRRSTFFNRFGKYDEGIKPDSTEFNMALSFIKNKGRGLLVKDIYGIFDQKNSADEPSTINRSSWREQDSFVVRSMRRLFLVYRYIKNTIQLARK